MEARLRALAPYARAWPGAMAQGVAPENARHTAAALAALTDELARLSGGGDGGGGGDADGGGAAQLRRAVIGATYVSAELFMVTDTSEDHAETWKFLRRRVADLSALGTAPEAAQDVAVGVSTAAASLASAVASLAGPVLQQVPGASTVAPAASAAANAAKHLIAATLRWQPLTDSIVKPQPAAAAAARQDGVDGGSSAQQRGDAAAAATVFAGAPEEDPHPTASARDLADVERELGLHDDAPAQRDLRTGGGAH
ncbi:hypothetical protein JKP88DRAFT_282264 [Tribonema minus]|uniref:Ubiquinone biosynthesis protein n=1 Tax=Tribonema minus TaxID=303371 RepID=A0A835YNY7_9STRA|nr:hypothetical protein JKP88DRAFT_282264 [Tribonema minus]